MSEVIKPNLREQTLRIGAILKEHGAAAKGVRMAWYDEAVFYHIYPLGLVGAPKLNDYGRPAHRLRTLLPWVDHLRKLGITALYIGPLFESIGHGYETTDYYKVDARLGENQDLAQLVSACHDAGIRVVLDGVFNHVGRDFFAFRDLQEKREGSPYRDWFSNVNFWGNNEYDDGFSYDNWGGHNLLVKLNQRNPAVREYLCDVVRFWVDAFDVDGIRLDAADVLDFDFMKALRGVANQVKDDFWLMGEVIHGEYSRWVNADMLHSVTDYALHKALYSGHNDRNYFEIAHTVRRTLSMLPASARLYNFVDNHDVERIATKLADKAHYLPVHILLYTLPGIPSIYYGSEFGIEGRKERGSDDSLRPCIDLREHVGDYESNLCTRLVVALGAAYAAYGELAWGDYRELHLTTGQFAFARGSVVVAVNNEPADAGFRVTVPDGEYVGLIGGQRVQAQGGCLDVHLGADVGEIFAPMDERYQRYLESCAGRASAWEVSLAHVGAPAGEGPARPTDGGWADAAREGTAQPAAANACAASPAREGATQLSDEDASEQAAVRAPIPDVPYEQMTVEQLQAVILAKMEANGCVTDRMRRDVAENIWHDSLVNWAKSF